ncbi:hypothetical protein LX32DRAFT_180444 [Colletotrichum zoysiae]|uniref:Uncharacterized protein n=1 Tax=Colletotrichum zoysiae TaxID=1216348 RepID=A0AAD9M8F1_9PEZI|nr:hypothetical protein LX32DRAFT_180444 [Colletotrichum zoysiae]
MNAWCLSIYLSTYYLLLPITTYLPSVCPSVRLSGVPQGSFLLPCDEIQNQDGLPCSPLFLLPLLPSVRRLFFSPLPPPPPPPPPPLPPVTLQTHRRLTDTYSSSSDTHRRLLNLLPPAQLGSTRLDSTRLASPPIARLAVSTPTTYTASLALPCSAASASTTYAAWKHPDTHTISLINTHTHTHTYPSPFSARQYSPRISSSLDLIILLVTR